MGVGLKQRRNDAKIEGLFFTTEAGEVTEDMVNDDRGNLVLSINVKIIRSLKSSPYLRFLL